MGTKRETAVATGKDGMQDVHILLPDGSRSNAALMDSLLEAPAPETRADRLARQKLYCQEFGITPAEFRKYFA
jgi:hypothetical protein